MSETTTVEPSDQIPLVSVDVGQGGVADLPAAQHSYQLDPALLSFLRAQGAPITAV